MGNKKFINFLSRSFFGVIQLNFSHLFDKKIQWRQYEWKIEILPNNNKTVWKRKKSSLIIKINFYLVWFPLSSQSSFSWSTSSTSFCVLFHKREEKKFAFTCWISTSEFVWNKPTKYGFIESSVGLNAKWLIWALQQFKIPLNLKTLPDWFEQD